MTAIAPSAAGGEEGSYPVPKLTFLRPSDADEAMGNNTRFLASYLERHLGVPVGVINMGGSACWVGWKHSTKSPTNGSMISYASSPNMLIRHLNPVASIGMDRTSFEFLVLYTSDDNIIMVKEDEIEFRDARKFLKCVKNNTVTISTAGVGTDGAVAVAMLEKELGFEFQHVYYRNSAEGLVAVVSGYIDALMGNVSEAVSKGEETMPVVVLSQEWSEYSPNIQCTYENDVKVAASSSRGVIVVKGLGLAVKEALLKMLKAVMEDPDQLIETEKQGTAVTPIYGGDFEQWMEQQKESIKGVFDLLDE